MFRAGLVNGMSGVPDAILHGVRADGTIFSPVVWKVFKVFSYDGKRILLTEGVANV